METMDTHIHASTHGTILYDAASVPQIDHAWFDPDHWRRGGRLQGRGGGRASASFIDSRSEEHTSELQSRGHLVCRLLLEKKKKISRIEIDATCRRTDHLRDHIECTTLTMNA